MAEESKKPAGKKSPLQLVKDKFESKAKLVEAGR